MELSKQEKATLKQLILCRSVLMSLSQQFDQDQIAACFSSLGELVSDIRQTVHRNYSTEVILEIESGLRDQIQKSNQVLANSMDDALPKFTESGKMI